MIKITYKERIQISVQAQVEMCEWAILEIG
jgi:hypothetical protein